MVTWPSILPQNVNVAGYQEQLSPMSARSKMDAGVAKARRRFSAVPIDIQCAIRIGLSQKATLDDFYKVTLAGGSLSFDWKHPVSGVFAVVRLKAPPSYTPVNRTLFNAKLDMEILP